MSYLKLVENYPKQAELTQFEKVLISARRAKDLHNGGKVPLVETEHKPAYAALEELRDGILRRIYREPEPEQITTAAPEADDDDDE
ncbi:MAG TPA: DNA-directed RNA polymerase subunit omega [bacterium]